jgi:hypothetical protein
MIYPKLIHQPLFHICMTAIIFANSTLAAQPKESNFSISPLVNILNLRNGQAKGVINITNKGQDPLRMRIYSENFTYDRSKGYVASDNHPQSAINYLQFAPRELVIPPGITRNVRVGTTIPGNLPDGEYRASIFAEDLNERNVTSSQGQQIKIQTRVACLFYFSKGANKSELSMTAATWDSARKDLLMVLSNKGKRTSYPAINWRLEKDGKVVIQDKFSGVLLQSATERELLLQSDSSKLTAGNYTFAGEIKEPSQKPIPFSLKVLIP